MSDGLSILKYADNIIIFLDHDMEKAKNMKLLLGITIVYLARYNFRPSSLSMYCSSLLE